MTRTCRSYRWVTSMKNRSIGRCRNICLAVAIQPREFLEIRAYAQSNVVFNARPKPGTYLFGGNWSMLNQFLVSYGMPHGANPVRVDRDSVEIFRLAHMVVSSKRRTRSNRPSAKSNANTAGVSDYYSILVQADIRRSCTPVEKFRRTRRLKRSLINREAIELVIGHLT